MLPWAGLPLQLRDVVFNCVVVMTESLLFVLFFCALCGCTPLDDYVDKPDSTYKYQELDTVIEEDGFTIYYLNMTSQKWLTGTPTHSIGTCYVSG